MSPSKNVKTLFDFTRNDDINNWTECSDSKKSNGTSKAVLVIQKTKLMQRALLFSLLNSRLDGQGGPSFASVECAINLDLGEYRAIVMKCRGQGINLKYKMLLKHDGIGKDAIIHGQIFMVSNEDFSPIKLPLSLFKPYYRGHELPPDSYNLDASSITHISIKMDNGSFLSENKPGVSVLEIDWIKAIK